ncbi:MAG: DUF11 domain-containing protein [Burkholderiales bacterium]|nr:DUF11 domain-containing protein [Burkholderiales bacterium]
MKKLLFCLLAFASAGAAQAAPNITATISPATPSVNQYGSVSYVVTLTNSGDATANLRLQINGPAGNEWHGINGGINIQTGGCSHLGTMNVLCPVSVPAGQSVQRTAEYNLNTLGSVTATCGVSWQGSPPAGGTIDVSGCTTTHPVVLSTSPFLGVRARTAAGVSNTGPITVPRRLRIDIGNGSTAPAASSTISGSLPTIPPSDAPATGFRITGFASTSPGWNCSFTDSSYTCSVPGLAPSVNEFAEFDIDTSIPYYAPVLSGIPTNTVNSYWTCAASSSSTVDQSSCTEQYITVMPSTGFSHSFDQPTASIGQARTLRAQINKPANGPTTPAVTPVVFIQDLPVGLDWVSSAGDGFACTYDTGARRVTCTSSTLDPAADFYFVDTVVTVAAAGTFTSLCHGDFGYPYGYGDIDALPIGSYSLCRATVTGIGAPLLTIEKSHQPPVFSINQPTGEIHIVVRNTGTAAANGPLTIVDVLPPGLTYVSSGGPMTCSAVDQLVTCTTPFGLAAPFGTISITLNVLVTADDIGGGSLLNVAGVGVPEYPMPNCEANPDQAQCTRDIIPLTLPVSLQSFSID